MKQLVWTLEKERGLPLTETKARDNQMQCTFWRGPGPGQQVELLHVWDNWWNVSGTKLQDITKLQWLFSGMTLTWRKGIWVFVILTFKLFPRPETSQFLLKQQQFEVPYNFTWSATPLSGAAESLWTKDTDTEVSITEGDELYLSGVSVITLTHVFKIQPELTFLLGTHMGVPCFTWPASTVTPITIGSRELKIYWGRIFILQGNTAICLKGKKKFLSLQNQRKTQIQVINLITQVNLTNPVRLLNVLLQPWRAAGRGGCCPRKHGPRAPVCCSILSAPPSLPPYHSVASQSC